MLRINLIKPNQKRLFVSSAPQKAKFDYRALFNLPDRGFPYSRFELVDLIETDNSNYSFKAWDSKTKKFVFIKFSFNPLEHNGNFLDYKHSSNSQNNHVVPALELYGPIRYFLAVDQKGPRWDTAKVRQRQLRGFDEYVEQSLNIPGFRFPEENRMGMWTALVKEWIPNCLPLNEYVEQKDADLSWIRTAVESLVESLARQGLYVGDLIRRPDGSYTGNIFVLPEEKRVVISDLGYSEECSYQSCQERYHLMMEDLDRLLSGHKLVNVSRMYGLRQQFFVLMPEAEAKRVEKESDPNRINSIMFDPPRKRLKNLK